MNTTNIILLTAVIVVVGKIATRKEGQPILPANYIMAVAGTALGLAVLSNYDEGVASKMALLILLSVLFVYVPTILRQVK